MGYVLYDMHGASPSFVPTKRLTLKRHDNSMLGTLRGADHRIMWHIHLEVFTIGLT